MPPHAKLVVLLYTMIGLYIFFVFSKQLRLGVMEEEDYVTLEVISVAVSLAHYPLVQTGTHLARDGGEMVTTRWFMFSVQACHSLIDSKFLKTRFIANKHERLHCK